jgi:hypothetical protein
VRQGDDYVRWDLEVLGGMFGSARMLMAVEDHGAGTQYVRIKTWPRCGKVARALLILFTVLMLLAALNQERVIVIIFAVLCAVIGIRAFQQAGQATESLQQAIQKQFNSAHQPVPSAETRSGDVTV